MTFVPSEKNRSKPAFDTIEFRRAELPSEPIVPEVRNVAQRQWTLSAGLLRNPDAESLPCLISCSGCLAKELGLCAGLNQKPETESDPRAAITLLTSSVHTIPARRTICHPKEWSEFIPIICHGWALSSIILPDGRRQILSFPLAGDLVSTASLLEPMSGRSVEAVTEVTYRKFKRSDLKAILFENPIFFENISKAWVEERTQSDQLALGLGRRSADERIARLILNLAERLAKRGMTNGQTMEFPLRQRHIADATGLTPVHVSKVMGEFQRAGLIEINSRSLTISDEAELRRVADWR